MKSKPLKNSLRPTLLGLILSTTLIGCGGGGGGPDSGGIGGAAVLPQSRMGIWERTGYGDIYQITPSGVTLYQYTRASCLKAGELDPEDVADYFTGSVISADRSTLVSRPASQPVFDTRFDRLDSLPASCLDNRRIRSATPLTIFEHFWHTFNDYYAFFEERDVDWAGQYAVFRPQVSDSMSDEALYDLLAAMLAPLDDGHIELQGGGRSYSPESIRGADRTIEEAFPLQSEFTDIQEYATALSLAYTDILFDYFDEGSEQVVDGYLPTRAIWATLGGGRVGYLYLASMALLSSTDEGLTTTANVEAVKTIMNDALEALRFTEAMIIDVRSSPGGHDAVSLAVAGYFTDQRRLAVTKRARSYLGETPDVEAYIEPQGSEPYLSPVAVIGGPATASAAEVFLMAMNTLPQVTLVGENSNGILSDTLPKLLPNGWEVSLSNEVYSDSRGISHEVSGVPPHVEAPVFSLNAIAEDRNAAIDSALEALGY